MYQIIWLEKASQEVLRHYEFLSAYNEPAAVRAVRAILAAGDSLATNPYRGSELRSRPGVRRLRVFFGKFGYILHYRVEDGVAKKAVIILRVLDGRQDRPL